MTRQRTRPAEAQLPPHDLVAEESLLGAAMLDADALTVALSVPADAWYKPAHQHIAAALRALSERGVPADPVTVADELERAGMLGTVGGHSALVELMSMCPATSNAAAHAGIITDKAAKRRLVALGGEITDMAHNGRDATDAVAAAGRLLDDLARHISNGVEPIEDDHPGSKTSVSTALVQIAHELYRFRVSTDGDTFAVPKCGPRVVAMLRGGKQSLRAQLAREYFARTGRAASQQGLADALLVIEGGAQQGAEVDLHLRVARHDGALWLDLGDPTGAAVHITPQGWSIEAQAPVLFRRTSLTATLPTPTPGGSLDDLWEWLNVEEPDRPLLAAWLAAALQPEIPHPALALLGEQGTGKTTAMKLIVSTIDATPVPARKPPKDADSWVTAAAGSWVVGLDNLSDIPPWLSDSLCRAVTGDGDVRRMLYQDRALVVFAFRRCLIFNGIDLGGLRGDLADRLVPIHLQRIDDTARIDEAQLWPAWHSAHPKVLGAVLDLTAAVERTLPAIHLDAKPRMADYARVLAAVDHVLATGGTGLARYLTKQGTLAAEGLTADDFITAIRDAIDDTFDGTSSELLHLVTPTDPDWRRPRNWPGNARAVTTRLHRQAPVMRKAGWTIDDDGGHNIHNAVRWTITPPTRDTGNDGSSNSSTPSLQPNPAPDDSSDSSFTSQTSQTTPPAASKHELTSQTSHEPPALSSDVWDLEHPCTICRAPAADISGLCSRCVAAARSNGGGP